MVYAGGSIVEKRGSEYVVTDGCAIDPDLPVAASDPDRAGAFMWYWPRYDQIDPHCRLAYLEWLTSGKNDPDISIGYVFLYFYGIERRIFLEGFESEHELNDVTREVQKLLEVYGSNNSFGGYASRFLETIALLRKLATNQPFEPDLDPDARGVSADTKVAIGRLLAHGQSVPFDWMMTWWLQDNRTRLRVSGTRCFPEFVELMRTRFTKRYPNGMQIEAPNSKLALSYRGASAAVSGDLSEVFRESLPDIETIRGPLDRIADIAEEAMDHLSPFARLIGRDAEKRNSLQAAALLPADCDPAWVQDELAAVQKFINGAVLGSGRVSFGELAERCGIPAREKLGRKNLEAIAGLLSRLGVGVEPDPLYGRVSASREDSAYLFQAIEEPREDPDGGYYLALAMTTLIAGIATASETGLGKPERRFLNWIENQLGLRPVQRQRLEAHLEWLISKKVRFTQVRKLMRELPPGERATMAALAVVVAKADGIIERSEMQFLEHLFDELGIQREHLYGVIHQIPDEMGQLADEPIEVQRGSEQRGHMIPQPMEDKPEAIGTILDKQKVEEIIAQTHQVANILTGIFADDEEVEEEVDDFLEGLDLPHKTLLSALLKRETWEREDLERLAQACDLMPDGALDTINEWGCATFGETILEDGTHVMVYRDVIVMQEGMDSRGR